MFDANQLKIIEDTTQKSNNWPFRDLDFDLWPDCSPISNLSPGVGPTYPEIFYQNSLFEYHIYSLKNTAVVAKDENPSGKIEKLLATMESY